MKVLNIEQTITAGSGEYWWRDWEDKAEGGTAPAKTKLPAYCYNYKGEIYCLSTERQTGWAGGHVTWEVKKASRDFATKIKEVYKII